ncbi:Hypothetical protein FKW44_003338 [Caligus rogercresseyi]|uniref:Uncharacterized protein n=1 Tax=Caligus rogercresseyi TaxID=217165 RepID=A0A7T8KLI5_CALRO|nr:Hypothetical protein FKW44_003338 [Caligus rogercresseyi]
MTEVQLAITDLSLRGVRESDRLCCPILLNRAHFSSVNESEVKQVSWPAWKSVDVDGYPMG